MENEAQDQESIPSADQDNELHANSSYSGSGSMQPGGGTGEAGKLNDLPGGTLDENLSDAPNDTATRAFDPPNALSAPKKSPAGPTGEPTESEVSKATDSDDAMRQTHIIPTSQTDHPSPHDTANVKSDLDTPLNQQQ